MRRLHTKKRPPTKELSFSLMGIAAIMNIAVARWYRQRVIVRVCRVLPTRCTPVTNFGYYLDSKRFQPPPFGIVDGLTKSICFSLAGLSLFQIIRLTFIFTSPFSCFNNGHWCKLLFFTCRLFA